MMCIESKAKSAKPYMAKKLWLGGISPLFQTEHLMVHHKNIIYILLGEETLSHEPWLIEEGESLSAQRKEETSKALTATCLEMEGGMVLSKRSHGKIIITRAAAENMIVAFVFPYSMHVIIFFRTSFDLERYMLNFKVKNFLYEVGHGT